MCWLSTTPKTPVARNANNSYAYPQRRNHGLGENAERHLAQLVAHQRKIVVVDGLQVDARSLLVGTHDVAHLVVEQQHVRVRLADVAEKADELRIWRRDVSDVSVCMMYESIIYSIELKCEEFFAKL